MKQIDIKILIKNYNTKLAKRQPWYTIKALAGILIEEGFQVDIISDKNDIQPNFKGVLIKVWSFKDIFYWKKKREYKLVYLLTFPFYKFNKIKSLNLHDFLSNFKGLYKIILVSFIPSSLIKCNLNRANAVISISDNSYNFFGNSVKYLNFIPFIFDNWGDKIYEEKQKKSKDITIGYFGSPISTRGFSDLLMFYKYFNEKYTNTKLKLITRIEREKLKNNEQNYLKIINDSNNVSVKSGFLDRAELADELQELDYLVLPFKVVLSELPIVVLEALEFGIPLITTRESGIESLITKNNINEVLFVENLGKSNYEEVIKFIMSNKNKVEFNIVKDSIININRELISELKKICQK